MSCRCSSNEYALFRLTSPTHVFIINLDPTEWKSFIISYSQHGQIILEKTEQDQIIIEDHRQDLQNPGWYLLVKLQQTETALFNSNEKCYIQIRCKYANEDVFASEIVAASVNDVINQTVM